MDNSYSRIDRTTQSNPSKALSTAITIDWSLDFEKTTLSGYCVHQVKILESTSTVDFDTSLLSIESVSIDDISTTFILAEPHKILGSKLSVLIPENKQIVDTIINVKIVYAADPNASAIQWLDASATKGGKFPYIFTQGQAIHTRSMLPCQDAPGVKTTYTATVRAPSWCTILMSALSTDTEKVTNGIYHFNQPVPTSAYLIALAGGNLESRPISERCAVWAEPEVVEEAAWEFAETEQFLSIAEDLTCTYAWGRYDVLCLPPSFPYGTCNMIIITFLISVHLKLISFFINIKIYDSYYRWYGKSLFNICNTYIISKRSFIS